VRPPGPFVRVLVSVGSEPSGQGHFSVQRFVDHYGRGPFLLCISANNHHSDGTGVSTGSYLCSCENKHHSGIQHHLLPISVPSLTWSSVIHFILIVVLVVVGISSHDARHYRPSGNLRHARRDRGRRARRRACPARGLWIPMTAAFEIASMRGLVALAYPVKCTA
jgi:hypothetical protein